MESETDSRPMEAAARRWLWATRAGALLFLLLWFVFLAWSERDDAASFLWWSPVWPAYVFIILRLRKGADKGGLALTVGLGSLVGALFLFSAVWGRVTRYKSDAFALLVGWFVFGLLQAAWALAAGKTFSALPREARDRRTLVLGFAKAAAILFLGGVCMVMIVSPLDRHQMPANESSAAGSLRTLVTAENTYAATYHSGFTDDLAQLGPPAVGSEANYRNADLVDQVLAGCAAGKTPPCPPGTRTFVKSLYGFIYAPRARDENGQIKGFTITARPVYYGNPSNTTSFFTDESSIIRRTSENRAATAADPPL